MDKSLIYASIDRKRKKKDFRRLWICRVNAAVPKHGGSYSKFRNTLKKCSIILNLKMLAQIALLDETTFIALLSKTDNKVLNIF